VKGEPFQMAFDIASIAARTLNNVQVEISHYGGITAGRQEIPAPRVDASCTLLA
jgi:hypothetical protein